MKDFKELCIDYNNKNGNVFFKRNDFNPINDLCIKEYGYITAELDNTITDCIKRNTTKKHF